MGEYEYEKDGFAIFRQVLDPAVMQGVRAHIDELLSKPGVIPENIPHHNHTHDKFWLQLVSDNRLLDVAQKFIGPDIALFASAYISKPPRVGNPILWR